MALRVSVVMLAGQVKVTVPLSMRWLSLVVLVMRVEGGVGMVSDVHTVAGRERGNVVSCWFLFVFVYLDLVRKFVLIDGKCVDALLFLSLPLFLFLDFSLSLSLLVF